MSKEESILNKTLKEMFSQKPIWETQKAIEEKLKKLKVKCSQSGISRALKEIGARDGNLERRNTLENEKSHIPNGWYLKSTTIFDNELALLKNMFNEATAEDSLFVTEIHTSIIKTKPYYNGMIANQIEKTFVDEVYSTLCSGNSDVIVFYTKDENESRYEKSISELFRTE